MNKRKIAVITAAVVMLIAAVTAIILCVGNSAKFKVKLDESSEKLTVTISGSTGGLVWVAENSDDDVVSVNEISNGRKTVFEITPKGEPISFFDVVFTLGNDEYFVFIKGMTDEDGNLTDCSDGYFDSCAVSKELNDSGDVSARIVDGDSVEISFPDDGTDAFNWEYETNENLSISLSYFGDEGVRYLVSASETGKYTAVFFNSEIGKSVKLKFSIDKDGVYSPDKISVEDYNPE